MNEDSGTDLVGCSVIGMRSGPQVVSIQWLEPTTSFCFAIFLATGCGMGIITEVGID